jgi:fumarate hydratase class II
MDISAPATRKFREETDTMGPIKVESDKLWGAETQRSLEYFSIGTDLIPRELIPPSPF